MVPESALQAGGVRVARKFVTTLHISHHLERAQKPVTRAVAAADFAPPPSVPRRPMAKRRKNKNAAPALRPVLLQPDQAGGPSAKEEKPIIAEKHWPALPLWIALHAERGPIRKCWSGHRLFRVPQDGRRYKHCEIRGCGVQPAAGSAVMACPQCRWMVAQT